MNVKTKSTPNPAVAGLRGSFWPVPDRLAPWAWVPLPVLLAVLVALWLGDSRTSFESPYLLAGLNFLFSTLVSVFVAFLIAQSFLVQRRPGLLLLGSGALLWGSAGFVGAMAALLRDGPARFDPNTTVTIANTCYWLSAVCHLAGAALSARWKLALPAPRLWLAGSYLLVLGTVALVTQATLAGWMPVFFVQGQGGTGVRQAVVGSALILFVLAALLLRAASPPRRSPFGQWYVLALWLLAEGMLGLLGLSVVGSPLNWAVRMIQWLGGLYMLMAALASFRESGADRLLFAPSGHEPRHPYGLAVAAVTAAAVVRLAFLPLLDSESPLLTFYPAIMFASLYGGFGPGLWAIGLAVFLGSSLWMEPAWQFESARFHHWIEIGVFCLTGSLIAAIAEAMQRAQARLYAAETEALIAKAREQDLAALYESAEQFRVMFELSSVGKAQTDLATGRLLKVNPAFCQLTGYSEAELLARTFMDITHPDERASDFEAYRRFAREEVPDYTAEKRYVRPDGGFVWVEVTANIVHDKAGRPVYSIGVIQDITERKCAEAGLLEADRRKDEFLAMLGHELRNPLAPIRNVVMLLKQKNVSPAKLAWCHDIIDRQVQHLTRLVDDLLDISRISRGKIELRKECLPLAEIVRRAVETVQPLVDSRRHVLTVELPPGPVHLEGDLVRLAQVVSNLLNNAAKYTDEGGCIALTAARDGDEAVIRVRDSGRGIEPDALVQLFDLFYQADRNLDRAEGGLGIGLSLVQKLVAMHGGTIEAHSEGKGRGSEFTVRLPCLPGGCPVGQSRTLEAA